MATTISVNWIIKIRVIGYIDMRFTLRQLQVFVAVAQQESVSRAAGLLNLSQSAASTSITELERQSSCQLFDRDRRSVALTAASVACLTIYDMLKSADKGMVIENIRLLEKRGGKSGDWSAP